MNQTRQTPTICPCCKGRVNRDIPLVDLNTNVVSYGDVKVHLRRGPAELMFALVECAPRLATKDHICSRLWGQGEEPAQIDKIIQVYICQIRRVLRNFPFEIINVFGEGYYLRKRQEAQADAA